MPLKIASRCFLQSPLKDTIVNQLYQNQILLTKGKSVASMKWAGGGGGHANESPKSQNLYGDGRIGGWSAETAVGISKHKSLIILDPKAARNHRT